MSSENLGPSFSSVRNQYLLQLSQGLFCALILYHTFPRPLMKECELNTWWTANYIYGGILVAMLGLQKINIKISSQKKHLKFDGMYLFSRLRIKSPYFNSTSPKCGVEIINCPIKFMISLTRPDSHILTKEISWQFFSGLPALLIS